MGWSTFLKTTGKYVLKGGRATVESAGSAVIHPQRTIKGLGTAAKTAAVGGGMAYVGWEKLTTDKSVTRWSPSQTRLIPPSRESMTSKKRSVKPLAR